MTKSEKTLDERYFVWLYSQVASVRNRNPARTYWQLFRKLYDRPFTYSISLDRNRAADGINLRYIFLDGAEGDQNWLELECSMLEMLVALSKRMEFQTGSTFINWFWRLLNNVEMGQYSDELYHGRIDEIVEETLDMIIARTYNHNGYGGLFPLHRPSKDQTKVEIWYQLAAYLNEHEDY